MKNTKSVRDFSILIALVCAWMFFGLASPQFLGARNLSMLTIEFSITAVLALGMLLIILPGNIDLSVLAPGAYFFNSESKILSKRGLF